YQGGRATRYVADVGETPAELGRIVARERRAHDVGGAQSLAREEQPLHRALAAGDHALEPLAPLAEPRGLDAQLPAFGLQYRERAVGVRDGALGVAQRVARLAALAFLRLEVVAEPFDARAQLLEIAPLEIGPPGRRLGG